MEFLAELYLETDQLESTERLVAAAAAEAPSGQPIRHLRTIVIPEDETLLVLYDAPSAEAVRLALERAGITCDRVTRATTNQGEPSPAVGATPRPDAERG
jgi:hypothetical protein